MKFWLTPVPSRFARPISPVFVLVQNTCVADTATPAGLLAPVMNASLASLPSSFARPIVLPVDRGPPGPQSAQNTCVALAATAHGKFRPVMNDGLTPVPFRFARPMALPPGPAPPPCAQ